MSLSMYVIADMLHIFKIVLLCDMVFMFKKREKAYNTINIIAVMMIGLSVVIYLWNNDNIESIAYIMAICAMLYWLYDEKLFSMLIFTIWITVILSMLDLMSMILLNILGDLFGINSDDAPRVGVAIVSLIIVFIFGKI